MAKVKHGGLRFLKVIVTGAEMEALDLTGKAFGFRNREQTIKHLIKNGYDFVVNELNRIQQEQQKLKAEKEGAGNAENKETASQSEGETGQVSEG